MALSLNKGKTPAKAATPPAKKAAAHAGQPLQQKAKKAGWFTRGAATATVMAQEDKRIEQKYSGMFRFFLEKDGSAEITFVDGFLTDSGVLDCFMFRQHRVNVHGKWQNFVCTGEIEPCPICESGDEPSLVGAFTIIDHTEFKGKKGIYKDRQKLFIAKRHTLKQLQALAAKRGGLSGWRVNVSRVGEKAAAVGDTFDFLSHEDEAKLRKMYVRKDEKTKKVESVFEVADYEKECCFIPAAELRKMGFGKGGSPVGAESGPVDTEDAGADAASELAE